MSRYCYVILNNAGHSWSAGSSRERPEPGVAGDQPVPPVLPQLLQDGWTPVRETPMGGGASPLAHSLILLEKADDRISRRRRRS
jgi:hypothetical protein